MHKHKSKRNHFLFPSLLLASAATTLIIAYYWLQYTSLMSDAPTTTAPSATALDALWSEVHAFDQKNLPKSSLAVIDAKIIPAAVAAGDAPAVVKAVLFHLKSVLQTEGALLDRAIHTLLAMLPNPNVNAGPNASANASTPIDFAPFPHAGGSLTSRPLPSVLVPAADFVRASGPATAIVHSLLGELYDQYLQQSRHRLHGRVDPGDGAVPEDMQAWAGGQLERAAFRHFAASVRDMDRLLAEPLPAYAPLLQQPQLFAAAAVPDVAAHMSSLLDVLLHRALRHFSSDRSFLAEGGAYQYLIPATHKAAAFGSAKMFATATFPAPPFVDRLLPRRYVALIIFQRALRVRLDVANDAQALSLAALDGLRATFVRSAVGGCSTRERDRLYLQLLEGIAGNAQERARAAGPRSSWAEAAADGLLELSKFHMSTVRGRGGRRPSSTDAAAAKGTPPVPGRVAAVTVLHSLLQQYPTSFQAGAASSLLAQITAAQALSLHADMAYAPGTRPLLLLSHQNVGKVKLRVLPAPLLHNLDHLHGGSRERLKLLLEAGPALFPDMVVSLTMHRGISASDSNDYEEHTTEIPLPEPIVRPGVYTVVAWPADADLTPSTTLTAVNIFHVSRIAAVEGRDAQGQFIATVDRRSGAPLPGVTVSFFDNNVAARPRIAERVSGEGGFVRDLPQHGMMSFALGEDVLDTNRYHHHWDPQEAFSADEHAFLFTDRHIYRPGQAVYVKALLAAAAVPGKRLPTVIRGRAIKIRLFSPDGVQIADLGPLTTSDHGTADGVLTLPSTIQTGALRLDVEGLGNSGANIRVEEYKRPRFAVTAAVPAQATRLGAEARIDVAAASLAGVPLADAAVRFTVTRTSRPSWIAYWRRPHYDFHGSNEAVSVATGEARLDGTGRYAIVFTAAGEDLGEDDTTEYEFTVRVDVVDHTGEGQSTSASLVAGRAALKISWHLPDVTTLTQIQQSHVSFSDLADQPVAEGTPIAARLEAVVVRGPHAATQRPVDRTYAMPERVHMTAADFYREYPHLYYPGDEDRAQWKPLTVPGAQALEHTIATVKGNAPPPFAALQVPASMGRAVFIRVTISATDAFGTPVSVSRTLTVFTAPEALLPDTITLDRPHYSPNDVATVTMTPWERFDGKPQPLLMVLASSAPSEKTKPTPPSSSTRSTTTSHGVFTWQSAAVPLYTMRANVGGADNDRGVVSAAAVYVAYGRSFTASTTAAPTWTDKQLNVSLLTFRDRMEPGSQQEWRVQVRAGAGAGKEGTVVPETEVLATLYDASLDLLPGVATHAFPMGELANLFRHRSLQINAHAASDMHQSHRSYSGRVNAPHNGGEKYRATMDLSLFDLPMHVQERASEGMTFNMLSRSMPGGAAVMRKRGRAQPDEGGAEMMQAAAFNAADGVAGAAPPPPATPEPTTAPAHYQPRTNLKETAFFFPKLHTDRDGTVTLAFTMAESLTRWRLLLFAHRVAGAGAGRALEVGELTRSDIVTQKRIMVTPNAPRFLRLGDTVRLSAKVDATDPNETIRGEATLALLDPVTEEPLHGLFGMTDAARTVAIVSDGPGRAAVARWTLTMPHTSALTAVKYRIVATVGAFGDGEEAVLPIVPSKILVTEAIALAASPGQTRNYSLDALVNSRPTDDHVAVVVEVTSNPAWHALQALPYLMEFPHECSEQIFSRLFANAIGATVVQSSPLVERVFEQWRREGSNALKSPLSTNHELKTAVLEESPWVSAAMSEAEQKRAIGRLFDKNRMQAELKSAAEKLQRYQEASSGGFPWFPGMRPSAPVTLHIATGIAQLVHTHAAFPTTLLETFKHAHRYCRTTLQERWDRFAKDVKRDGAAAAIGRYFVGQHEVQFLYMDSFTYLHKGAALGGVESAAAALVAPLWQEVEHRWATFDVGTQALACLAAHRTGRSALASAILLSLRERAVQNAADLSWRWPFLSSGSSGGFHLDAVEVHSVLVEVFREVAADTIAVDAIRTHLLQLKRTTRWPTTKGTAAAVYAVLLGGAKSWARQPAPSEAAAVVLDGAPVHAASTEAGTGYFKHRIPAAAVVPSMGRIQFANPAAAPTIAWGAVYWQAMRSMADLAPSAAHAGFSTDTNAAGADVPPAALTVRKQLFRMVRDGTQEVPAEVFVTVAGTNHSITNAQTGEEQQQATVGEILLLRMTVAATADMQYVHLRDQRIAGTEPVDVISGVQWLGGGLLAYTATRDLGTNYYIERLHKGTHVFEYRVRVAMGGHYAAGVATAQCMYAPEMAGHSGGGTIELVG